MRSLWFVAGAGAGIYLVVRARRAAEILTPEGLHDRLEGIAAGWQVFSDEVRTGMAEREQELHTLLLGGEPAARALPPAPPDDTTR